MKDFILRAWEGLGPACFALFTLPLWTSCLRCVHPGHSSRVLNLCWNSQPVYIIILKGYLSSCFHIPFVPPALYFLLSILKFIKYFLIIFFSPSTCIRGCLFSWQKLPVLPPCPTEVMMVCQALSLCPLGHPSCGQGCVCTVIQWISLPLSLFSFVDALRLRLSHGPYLLRCRSPCVSLFLCYWDPPGRIPIYGPFSESLPSSLLSSWTWSSALSVSLTSSLDYELTRALNRLAHSPCLLFLISFCSQTSGMPWGYMSYCKWIDLSTK